MLEYKLSMHRNGAIISRTWVVTLHLSQGSRVSNGETTFFRHLNENLVAQFIRDVPLNVGKNDVVIEMPTVEAFRSVG